MARFDCAETVSDQMHRCGAVGGERADHDDHLLDLVAEGDVLELAVAGALAEAVVGADDCAGLDQASGDLHEEALWADAGVTEAVHDQDGRGAGDGVARAEFVAADHCPLCASVSGVTSGFTGAHLSCSCLRSLPAGRRAPCR